MKKYIFLIIISTACYSQWTQFSNGLYNGSINDLCYGNGYIFAASINGVYKSSDNGNRWQHCDSLPAKSATDIKYSNGKLIVNLLGYGIYISNDNGVTWSKIYNYLFNHDIRRIESMNGKIYATIEWAGVMMSTNYGISWIRIDNDSISNGFTASILGYNNVLYVSFSVSGLMKTSNDGLNWITCQHGLVNGTAESLIAYDNKIYATDGFSLFKSSNTGETWDFMNLTFQGSSKTCLYADSIQLLVFHYPEGLYRTTTQGQNWSLFNNFVSSFPFISKILKYINYLIVSSSNEGIYSSTNNGANWISKNIGITDVITTKIISDGINLFVSTSYPGVFLFGDTSWIDINDPLYGNYAYTIFKFNNYLFNSVCNYNISCGTYRSSDNGYSWSYSGIGFNSITAYNNNLYAGNVRIYKSIDNGTTWNIWSNLYTIANPILTLHYFNNMMYAGIWNLGIYRIDTAGIQYQSINEGLGDNPSINVIKSKDNNLYAGLKRLNAGSYSGLYYSSNFGNYWLNMGIHDVAVNDICFVDQNIIVATFDGIKISTNHGISWQTANIGLSNTSIRTLAIHNNYLYAGTSTNSVWRRTLSEVIGIESTSQNIPDRFELYQNYPNPFNPKTKIKFSTPKSPSRGIGMQAKGDLIKIIIYNSLGQEVNTFVNEMKSGIHEVEWDASSFASGVYFYSLIVGDNIIDTKKLVMVK